MSTPSKTIARKVFDGTQVVLSTLGLSGAVEGTIGLGDMAVELISYYLQMSDWILMQISKVMPAPPDFIFHYFLLGAPFWTPMFLGLRRILGRLSLSRSSLSYIWEILSTHTGIIVAEFYAAHHRKGRSRLWPAPKPVTSEVRRKWREFRKRDFWAWLKISAAVNMLRITMALLVLFIIVFLTIFPLLMVMVWPLALLEATTAKLRRRRKQKSKNADPKDAAKPPDHYSVILSRSLDRFTLVVVIFVIFTSVSAGIERNGGAEAIYERFKEKLEDATQ